MEYYKSETRSEELYSGEYECTELRTNSATLRSGQATALTEP